MVLAKDRLLKSIGGDSSAARIDSEWCDTRLKCMQCKHFFRRRFNFDRHIHRSNGRCAGSIPIRTAVSTKAECKRFAESESTNSSCSLSKRLKINELAPVAPTVTTLQVVQVVDNEENGPLLPPDYFCNNDLGTSDPVNLQDTDERDSIYRYLLNERRSNRRKRKFVFGALYEHLVGGYKLIDCRGTSGQTELQIEIEGDSERTTITVMNVCDCKDLLESVVHLGKSLGKRGNARKGVGDVGEMWGLGYRSKGRRQKYVKTDEPAVKEAMRSVCDNVARDLRGRFPMAWQSIVRAEQDGTNCPSLPEMGGEKGPGSCIMISKNLGNSAHFDYRDRSLSLAVLGGGNGRLHFQLVLHSSECSTQRQVGCSNSTIPWSCHIMGWKVDQALYLDHRDR
jgi:uncharacterized C2H2 Zn-finger protein